MYVIDFRVNVFYDLTFVKNLRLVKLCASQIIFGKIYPLEAAFPMVISLFRTSIHVETNLPLYILLSVLMIRAVQLRRYARLHEP